MGKEFNDLFDDWADSYDATVQGGDPAYAAVFENYDRILAETAAKARGPVLEFGVGTANLTAHLLSLGLAVHGIEPSANMREIALKKYPEITLYNGDFLEFPALPVRPASIVSSYAFHHLTDFEKDQALAVYSKLLPVDGRIIIADTMFIDPAAKAQFIETARKKNWNDLADDLEREYYPYISDMHVLFGKHGFETEFERKNQYVWLMSAVKK